MSEEVFRNEVRREVRTEVRTEVRHQASGFNWRNHVYTEYFRTPEGLMKIGEFVLLLLGLIIASAVAGGKTDISSIEFFIFATTAGFICSICHILLIIVGIYPKLPAILLSNIVNLVIYAVAFIIFLIASIAMMAKFSYHGSLVAAGIIGLICAGLFFVEFVIWFTRYRSSGPFQKPSDGGESGRPQGQDEFSDPQQHGY